MNYYRLSSPYLPRTFPVATPFLPRSYPVATPLLSAYFFEPCPYPPAYYRLTIGLLSPYYSLACPNLLPYLIRFFKFQLSTFKFPIVNCQQPLSLESNCSIIENIPPKGVSCTDFMLISAMPLMNFICFISQH